MKKPKKEEAMRWFTHAKDEFNDADELRKRQRFYLALFHFQQSSEKALKAYLYLKVKSIEVFYTHSINDLLNMVIEIDSEFKETLSAKKLDQYYFPTRYPNSLPGGIPSRYYDDPKEAENAMILAKSIIDLVDKKIKKE
ncbi:MAG: HEPN domain-containing protein [Promethearchaeota archaeon]|nr:MAG: HEPN domain-containing protein [Candidatus Lokiarchaeota archaeon]